MAHRLFLSTGSNIGDRFSFLNRAVTLIEQSIGRVIVKSSIYETSAWGLENQADFLNQVLEIETTLSPTECLAHCLEIEQALDRIREVHWGPRTIDIDLLYWNTCCMHTESLTLPHPRIAARNFVLMPLAEIAADFIDPALKQSVQQLKEACKDNLPAIRIEIDELVNLEVK
jgi:2-amino-4-hydroxy-6-hydroxymethyldihydropteridine diphosphokinase